MKKRILKCLLLICVVIGSVIMIMLGSYLWGCYSKPFSGQIVDKHDVPVQSVFVLYILKTDSLSPGGANEHAFSSGILETDKDGRFSIPGEFHLHMPLFETKPTPVVDLAYSAETHSFVGRGNFHKDFNDQEMNVQKVVLPDTSNDLHARVWALSLLTDAITFEMSQGHQGRILGVHAAPGVKERFVSMLLAEYDFLSSKASSKSSMDEAYLRESGFAIKIFDDELKHNKEIRP